MTIACTSVQKLLTEFCWSIHCAMHDASSGYGDVMKIECHQEMEFDDGVDQSSCALAKQLDRIIP